MKEWDPIFEAIADDPDDFERTGGTIALRRNGKDCVFTTVVVPQHGICVDEGEGKRTPLAAYIQRELLAIPHLQTQIVRTIERRRKEEKRSFYIEGSAEHEDPSSRRSQWEATSGQLMERLRVPEAGATHLIRLMAPAGVGKTSLLEECALLMAQQFIPGANPNPLLLHVDLLGRSVGTIEDAIAGSLNNQYSFAGLFQRQLEVCISQRWLVLALDGFDELVARVGVRDAFLRLSELIDRLDQAGTVIISARESFFDLHEIGAGMRSYLLAKGGSFTTSIVRLKSWTQNEATQVFSRVGSTSPAADFADLKQAFAGDEGIVCHPFFLTRLASLWQTGERFTSAPKGRDAKLDRARYVIEAFVARETETKWRGREPGSAPHLDAEGHRYVLGAIAEQMWSTGVLAFSADELRLSAEIGLSELNASSEIVAYVKDRIPTHAVIASRGRQYSFFHDQFMNYFLGHRIAVLLSQNKAKAVGDLLRFKDFAPVMGEWVSYHLHESYANLTRAAQCLDSMRSAMALDPTANMNHGQLLVPMLDVRLRPAEAASPLPNVSGSTLSGQTFLGRRLVGQTFSECKFWNCEMEGSYIENTQFVSCVFAGVSFDDKSTLVGVSFQQCEFERFRFGEEPVFEPGGIERRLEKMGARIIRPQAPAAATPAPWRPSEEVSQCLEWIVDRSVDTCDVAEEVIVDKFGKLGKRVVRLGLETGVLKLNPTKNAGGPRKTFVRFEVDRERLMRTFAADGSAIGRFWKGVRDGELG